MATTSGIEPIKADGTLNPGPILDKIGVTRSHVVILLLVMTGGFFDVFEQNGVSIVGPSLQATWGISAVAIGWLASVTFGSMVIGGILAGVLADIAGRKVLFTFNLAVYSLGGLVCAFAPNYEVLMLGRVVVGLGLGGELTIALPLLSELTPTRFRGTAVSLFNLGAGGLGNPISFAFGFLILGLLGPYLGGIEESWRWFFGLLALPALLVLYLRRNLPETPRFLVSQGRIHEANLSLSVLASGRLDPKNTTVTPYLDAAVAERHTPARPKRGLAGLIDVFRGYLLRNTLTVGIGSFMSFGAQIAVLTLIPIILVARGYTIGNSLGFAAVMQIGSLLGTALAAYLNYRLPRRWVVMASGLLAGAFALAFGFAGTTVATILIYGFWFNFFTLFANTTLWTWAPELYPTRVRASGTSVIVNSGLLGQAVMPALAGLVFSVFGIYAMFAMIAVMFLILAVLAFFAPETLGRNLEELHGEA